ncbi:hypothetical protein ACWGJP_06320 [Microbacterium sp. NPDC055903]
MKRNGIRELAGWLAAVAIGIAVTAQVSSTARGDLVLRDGDSLVVALLSRSVTEGHGVDWSMSSVLFLPETAVLTLLRLALPLGIDAALLVNAVVNVVALYGALRLAAGRRMDGRAPVAWSVIAVAVFAAICTTELSGSRDALELASLLLTTTYYSATVIATVAAVGISRRAFDREAASRGLNICLASVAALSTLTNPLFAAWATVPLGLVLAIAALRTTARPRALTLLAWLAGGTALGLLGRIPFSAWIENSGAGYAQPHLWPQSAEYYVALMLERLSSPLGWLGGLVTVALLVLAVRSTVRARSRGARLVAASAWMLPLVVVIGAIALGTNAARYLQPVVFAPLLALVAASPRLRLPSVRTGGMRVALAAVTVVVVAAAGWSTVRLVGQTRTADADLACTTAWIDASGRTGAGQFWTVRLPKLHLADPAQLVQVDHQLNGYAWLVDRRDFDVAGVSFLIEDSQTQNWVLPADAVPSGVIECGRYTIYDFSPATLPLGLPHS